MSLVSELEFMDEVPEINELLWRFVNNYSNKYSCELVMAGTNELVTEGTLKGMMVYEDPNQAIRDACQNKAARLELLFARKNKAVIFQYENYLFRSEEINEEIKKYDLFAQEIGSRINQGMPGFNSDDYQKIIDYINNLEQRKNKAFLYIKVSEVDNLDMIIDDIAFSNAYK